ncbi:MAG TPA: DUF2330 domain-containing protein [Rhodocyclaceae bacterium]|nr:DUF2330 domain-containing protein [Rhodocyclaceae bacterium]HMZ84162.1 DUF2330 domain-containing protein [Rhodocyclaceae bacterium]HNB77551.1 DUF2330 domain-containing protein [Rhodocyclaceae bacterium]HNH14399.1 DUF2330 domain-containing protein [Rhodocyclaceae bacterium]HNI00209.1 DUF2330 domain-containing protein [Rhodocyclaceae bacterium]
MSSAMSALARAGLIAASLSATPAAQAFCGFYVGRADASLFNETSQAIMVRDGTHTVISMQNDFQGDAKEFALVVPVPQVLKRDQINVGERRIFERIDAYSGPRLVEYFDPDPCARPMRDLAMKSQAAPAAAAPLGEARRERALGVTVEAQYTVGEYDIAILSAKESDGLETWLTQNGYRIPRGASKALAPYIRQNMKFFVARVNLAERAKTGLTWLRPLQFAFDSEKFMLPIRLGMVNAKGPQDLVIYVLTKNGRVETTNYRTVKLPANMDVPVYLKNAFPAFYKSLFDTQARRENLRAVFTEYVWDMNWCDPCAADPLSPDELRQAGVFWLGTPEAAAPPGSPPIAPPVNAFAPRRMPAPAAAGAQPVILTRLHVRYAPDTFPEDLMFQETKDRANFQARYVLRHAWKGDPDACPEARGYLDSVAQRQEKEAQTLASLTDWKIEDIRQKMNLTQPDRRNWWDGLWKQGSAK